MDAIGANVTLNGKNRNLSIAATLALITVFSFTLTACGGGGGGSAPAATNTGASTATTSATTTVAINGTLSAAASKPSSGKSVQLYAVSSWAGATLQVIDSAGTVVGTGTVNADGTYSVSVPTGSNYFIKVQIGNLVLKAFVPSVTAAASVNVNTTTTAEVMVLASVLGVANIGDSGVSAATAIASVNMTTVMADIGGNASLSTIAASLATEIAGSYDAAATATTIGSASATVSGTVTTIAGTVGGSVVPAPPSAPTGVGVTAGNAQATVSWTAVTGATSYNVYRGTSASVTTANGTKTTGATSGAAITGLTNGTAYYFVVTAVGAGGESAVSSEVGATPQVPVPGVPSGVGVTTGDAQATISWTAVTGATSYNVYRGTSAGVTTANGTKVTGATSGGAITGLGNGTTYYFVVTAVNAGGESAVSSEVSATPQVPAPGAPTGVGVTAGSGQVTISWSAATGATSYNVYHKTSTGVTIANGTKVTGHASGSAVTGLANGTTYYFVVTAVNAGGESVVSSEVNATPAMQWIQQAYLKAPNAEAGDVFGVSVSVNADTVAVGANMEDSNQTTITNGTTASIDNTFINPGAVYVFKRTGTTWAQEAYLKAPNAETNDGFGYSVSVNADTVAVGAFGEDSNQTTITNGTTASADNTALTSGAVYVFKRTGTTWAQEAYLKAPNAEAGDNFGIGVSVDADTVAVGAWGEDSNQTTITNGTTASADNTASGAGAVYVFKRTGATWAQEAYLKAPNAEAADYLGYNEPSVNADTVAVGAYWEDSNQTTITNGTTASADNSAVSSGAVYVFKRTGTTWAQEAYLKAPNAEGGDQFGFSVSVNADTVAVGANLEDSNQTTITNGTTASADNTASGAGAVYIFKRTGATWAQEAYLKAPNGEFNDDFGYSVSVNADTVAVGADLEDSNQTTITNGTTASADNTASGAGAVYVFKRTGATWAQEAYLKAPNAEADDQFGYSVSVNADTVAVGAYLEDSNQTTITNGTTASADNTASGAGAVYIFTRQ